MSRRYSNHRGFTVFRVNMVHENFWYKDHCVYQHSLARSQEPFLFFDTVYCIEWFSKRTVKPWSDRCWAWFFFCCCSHTFAWHGPNIQCIMKKMKWRYCNMFFQNIRIPIYIPKTAEWVAKLYTLFVAVRIYSKAPFWMVRPISNVVGKNKRDKYSIVSTLQSFRHLSERRFCLAFCFLNKDILFWLTISYQKPFFCFWFCLFLSNIYSKVKFMAKQWSYRCKFYSKVIFFFNFCLRKYFVSWIIDVSQQYCENFRKNWISGTLLKICLQVTYPTDFCIICIHFYFVKKWKY